MRSPRRAFQSVRTPFLALLSVVLPGLLAARAAVTTEVTFNDPAGAYAPYYGHITSHVQAGMSEWTAPVALDLTVRVVVRFAGDGAGGPSTGRSVTNAFVHTNGTRSVQMEGLAAKLTGLIPASSTAPDVDLFINPGTLTNALWFDPQPTERTAPVPADKTDAVSLCMELIGHALGFNGFFNPATRTFPDAYESAFDEHIVADGTNFSFNGAGAAGAYGGPVPLTSSYPYVLGGNLSDDLMTGAVFAPGRRYDISALDRAILKDTGLDLDGPPVSLAATAPTAAVGGAPGVFTFSIPAALSDNLTIHYTVKGNAANGVDYAYFKGTTKIKAGQTSKALKVKATGNLGGAAKRTVKLTLAPGAGYRVETASAAKVKIFPGP